ncbi:uncharacterized protein LOC134009996 [Osmerus eperlanus]|uniref:uncharacterized protein LOC134009996 n=1 Tax=Osmerus eperlanus TaxID=29151 RepID=UPI002E0EA1F2
MKRMEDSSKCTTIFLSQELRQASENALATDDLDTSFDQPETTAPSLLRQQSHHWSLGIRRSLASTDLLNNPRTAHSAVSLDSQEGRLPVHSDSRDELSKMEFHPTSDTQLNPKGSCHSSRPSLEDMVPASGEGKCSTAKMGEVAESVSFEDARDGSAKAGPEDEVSEFFLSINEEDEAEEGRLIVANRPKGKNRHDVAWGSTESSSKYLQEFHSLPKRLIPSEIAHCLYDLEEECRGVERESRSVKWKMELIHRSVQALQETLRTLLTHLVEAQTSDTSDLKTPTPPTAPSSSVTPAPVSAPPPSEPDSDVSEDRQMSDAYCTHQHCPGHRGLARCPSETCLPESYQNKNCCARLTDSIDEALPSCAQRKKERAAAFHAIKELRTEVERLRLTHEEEHREHQEILGVVQDFQNTMEALLGQWNEEREELKGHGSISSQIELLRQQATNVTKLTQQAVAVFCKVGVQLEGLGAVGTLVRTASTQLTANSGSPQQCQTCSSKVADSNEKRESET